MISRTFKILLAIQVIICLGFTSFASAQTKSPGQDDYLYARRLFDEGYFDLAAEQLSRVLADNPGMANADDAQFLLGESLMLAGKPKDARAAFLRVVIVFPESPRAPEAMLNIGIALEEMEQFPEAVQAYRRVHSFYPQSSLTTESLRRALLISANINDKTETELIGDLLIEKYPYSEAADQARLLKAKSEIELGNQVTARSYLERIAERTLLDSLASKAYLMLGRLFRDNWELNSADQAFRKALKRDSTSHSALEARLELAILLNYRGLPDEAIQVLQPLIKNQRGEFTQQAIIRAGDASYRKGDLNSAYQVYSKSNLSEAKLKAAWVAERLGYTQKALDGYYNLSMAGSVESKAAKLRAAQLASLLSQNSLAERLWSEISMDSSLYDPYGQSLYELAKVIVADVDEDSYQQLSELNTRLIQKFPQSPYLDDVLYIKAKTAENLEKYSDAKSECKSLIKLYPASQFSDSALVMIDFLERCKLRGDKLMERMAALSSTPMTSKNPVKWSLDWGDFYLNDFKDPVKAIDQYDFVIESSDVTGKQVIQALQNSCDAYLRLYQIAVREQDTVSIEMYRDSTHTRLTYLDTIAPLSEVTFGLKSSISATDLSIAADQEAIRAELLYASEEMLRLKDHDLISPFWISTCLRTITNLALMDSAIIADWFVLSDIGLQNAKDKRDIATIKWFQVNALDARNPVVKNAKTKGVDKSLISSDSLLLTSEDIAAEILEKWGRTPAAFEAAWWLVERSSLDPQAKFQKLELIESEYYYVVDPEIVSQTKGNLLDSLGRHLDALNTQVSADKLANWGRPELDILSIPDSEERYRRAWSFMKSDSLYLSALEYRILLNMEPKGEYAAPALLDMANILATQGLTEAAIQYLDTLYSRFPYSPAATEAEHIHPLLELEVEHYAKAFKGFKTLRAQSQNLDSSYFYDTQMILCLYRQNLLEEARLAAKELYRNYEDRKDIDDAKARFYLEKGRSLDRTKQFDLAMKQYKIVIDDYYLSQRADDAEYSLGLSLLSQNKFQEAILTLTRFTENHPESDLLSDVKVSLGMAYVRSEKYSEGISTLKHVWVDPNSSRLWVPIFKTLITLYRKMHFFDAGIKLTREYIERFPNAEDIFDRKMEIGQFYLQIGEWDESVRHYRPLLQIADAEREAEIQYYIGEAYFNKGEFRTAILEFIKVPVLGRKTKLDWGVTALYQAATCYEKLGEPEGAIRMYRQIISETGATSNYGRAAQEKLNLIEAGNHEQK